MWSRVSTRSHHPLKIFPFDSPATAGHPEQEVMIYGTVEYGLKAGGSDRKEWAARAVLASLETGGEWRMRWYQVYLVSLFPFCFWKAADPR